MIPIYDGREEGGERFTDVWKRKNSEHSASLSDYAIVYVKWEEKQQKAVKGTHFVTWTQIKKSF